MSKIVYEKLEDFLNVIKAGVTKNTKPIYVSVLRRQDMQQGLIYAEIGIQLIQDDGFIPTYRYTDLPVNQIRTEEFFNAMLNKEDAEKAKKNYEDTFNANNKKIEEEYNKILGLLKDIGYEKIVSAIVE